MTDLPDLPPQRIPGSPDHINDHDRFDTWLADVKAEYYKGIEYHFPPIPAPAVHGNPGHINAHKDLWVAAQYLYADYSGDPAFPPFPDQPVEGADGHVVAHNKLRAIFEYVTQHPPIRFNQATGGTVSDYTRGDGTEWRVHTFTSSGTFTVSKGGQPFQVLVVGGGGGGGKKANSRGGGGGGGGGVLEQTLAISTGAKAVVVGDGGSAGNPGGNSFVVGLNGYGGQPGTAGNANSHGGTSGAPTAHAGGNKSPNTFTGGGGGGAGGNGSNAADGGSGPGGPGLAKSTSGSSVTYGAGGIGYQARNGRNGYGEGGGGNTGGSGGSGIVIIAYQIGPIPPRDLVCEFDTTLGDRTIEMPLQGTVDAVIDWGDGTSTEHQGAGVFEHTYDVDGIYTVRVSGTATQFGAERGNDGEDLKRPELVRCLSFGEIGLTSLHYAFRYCENVTTVPAQLPITSTVTNMHSMFDGAHAFNQDLSGWDVSRVTDMNFMFANAYVFDQDLSGWDVSRVTDMSFMFANAYVFDQDLSGWDVSRVTDMSNMFANAYVFDQDLSGWCVENIPTEPQYFAAGADAWTQPKPIWGTCP